MYHSINTGVRNLLRFLIFLNKTKKNKNLVLCLSLCPKMYVTKTKMFSSKYVLLCPARMRSIPELI